eukprot:5961882-Prymnesium_polylepis.1
MPDDVRLSGRVFCVCEGTLVSCEPANTGVGRRGTRRDVWSVESGPGRRRGAGGARGGTWDYDWARGRGLLGA